MSTYNLIGDKNQSLSSRKFKNHRKRIKTLINLVKLVKQKRRTITRNKDKKVSVI